MSSIRNRVRLIGNVGANPEVKTLESGKKMAEISLATNESYKNDFGDRVTDIQWHRIVAWGKIAEIMEKYVNKGSEIAVEGRLVHRSYKDKNGEKRYITEIHAQEILLL